MFVTKYSPDMREKKLNILGQFRTFNNVSANIDYFKIELELELVYFRINHKHK